MAFDPRTGITSYAPSGAAAVDPSAAAAGVVPAPSTATSLDAIYDKYFPEWRTSDPYGGAAPSPGASYDPYNSVWQGGAGPLDVAGRAAQSGNLADWLLAFDRGITTTEYEDPYNMTGSREVGGYQPYGFYGQDAIVKPLD